jgi:hypothetical protein
VPKKRKPKPFAMFFAALPVVGLDAVHVQPARRQQAVIPAPALVQHLGLGDPPEKMTVSIGNFSIRKCVLKKWNEKMKPAASRASSECTTIAMLMIQPGEEREELREPQDHPEKPMIATPQNTAK